METSQNVLYIESISTIPEYNDWGVKIKAELKAQFQLLCPVTGGKFQSIDLEAYGCGYSQDMAIKEAVQNFIDGNSRTQMNHYDAEFHCLPDHKTIHSIQYEHLGEPWIELFDQLLKTSNWSIVKLLRPVKSLLRPVKS